MTFLAGTPTLDLSAGAQFGLVGNAPDATYIEEEFAGFDFALAAGPGVGFSLMFWRDVIFATVTFGGGLGYHVAAADSWTFELTCTYGY